MEAEKKRPRGFLLAAEQTGAKFGGTNMTLDKRAPVTEGRSS